MDFSDALLFLIVVGARLGVPLLIFRFPLPAILAVMLIDAADQTIFQNWSNLNLDNYQSYDKALDIYYLAIAYISTMRNWVNLFAFRTGRFLWYYRLVGVMLFELLQWRALLLVFANSFEYYFDYYEAVKTRWNPLRMTVKHIIQAAAIIWVVIKLPQEYWIHVAKLDTTDVFKEHVFGVSVDTGWGEAISQNLWFIPVAIVLIAALAFAIRAIYPRLPRPDWPLTFDADTHADEFVHAKRGIPTKRAPRVWLAEKILLLGVISVIFGQVLPGTNVSNLQMFIGVSVILIANSFVSHWLALRGTTWRNSFTEFLTMAAINAGLVVLFDLLTPEFGGSIRLADLLFFILLITLIVTLYDRYRPVHDQRFGLNDYAPVEPVSSSSA